MAVGLAGCSILGTEQTDLVGGVRVEGIVLQQSGAPVPGVELFIDYAFAAPDHCGTPGNGRGRTVADAAGRYQELVGMHGDPLICIRVRAVPSFGTGLAEAQVQSTPIQARIADRPPPVVRLDLRLDSLRASP